MNRINNFSDYEKLENFNHQLKDLDVYDEIKIAFDDWTYGCKSDCVLIGGLAMNFNGISRNTQDVDFLFLTKEDIPNSIINFKRHRENAFQHNRTHVEIELLTNSFINTDQRIIEMVFKTSILYKNSIRIATPSALIALKLGRANVSDITDIKKLYHSNKIDLSDFNLSDELIGKFNDIISDVV